MKKDKKDSPIDVLLITAVKDELDVVLNVEPDWQPKEDSKGFPYYTWKVIGNAGNEFRIAAARPIDKGGDFASNIATRLVNELKPHCLAMVGICAGWRGKVFLGDVIVADRVFRYDAGKLKAFRNGDIRTEVVLHDIRTNNLKPLWVQKAQDFPSDWISTVQTKRPLSYSYQELWLLYAQEAFESGKGKTPVDLEERKTQCPDWTEVLMRLVDKGLIKVVKRLKLTEEGRSRVAEHKIRYPDDIPQDPDKPKTYVAPMGTVSQVKEDLELFPTIEPYMREVLAVEMEAAAIGAVAEIEDVESCIIVKGVADYADPDRDDLFRFYAIEASYRFLMAFLKENLEVEKRSDREKDIIREIHQIVPLDSRSISPASPEKINDFYSGGAPSPGTPSAWDVIAAGAVKRDLEDKIEQVLQEDGNFHIICIVAEPGAGKTTLAMKVLYRLSQRGEQAFWLQVRSAEFWYDLSELTGLINDRLYVFIDNIFRDIDFVEALQDINKGKLPVTIIATSRTNEYKDRNLKEFIKKMELKVSENEKKELLERIGKSYVDLSPDERRDFNETDLFLVLGMVLSKGKGFSEIIEDIVEKLKLKDEVLYRAYEYVCFSSNYDISIPEDLLRKLDKQGRFYGLLDEKSERGRLAKGIFYEDSVPSYPTCFIKAGHQLIAKEALLYYSRYPKVLFEEILEAADEENWVNRRYITLLIRAILEEGQGISNKDVKDVITKSEKIAHMLQYASISELNWWKLIYKQLNLQEAAEKCAEEILLRTPNTTLDCQLLVSEYLNKGLIDNAFSTIRDWLEGHSEDKIMLTRSLSLVNDNGSQEQIEEVIEETRLWLKDHPEDNMVRRAWLTLIKGKGNQEQIRKGIKHSISWLKDHPDDNTVRVYYLALIKEKGTEEQIEEVIEETRLWLKDHPEDQHVRAAYLSLIKEKGNNERIEEEIEGITKWLQDHPEDNMVREVWLTLIRDKGNHEQIRNGIGDSISWLQSHPADNRVRSVYISLVREKSFFEEDIKPALDDVEQWMKKYGPHPLFQDYLPLIEKIIKTEIDVDINIELVKQFGYKFIKSFKWEGNFRLIRDFADWLRREEFFDEAEQIYESLLKIKIRNKRERSTIYLSLGKMFFGQAMSLEFTNENRLKKLIIAEEKFREALKTHKGHHMAHSFLAITLKGRVPLL